MNPWSFFKKSVLTVILTGCILTGCGHRKASDIFQSSRLGNQPIIASSGNSHIVCLTSDAERLADIQFTTANSRLVDFSVKTTGEVQADANRLTHVTTPVTGRVIDVMAMVGEHVEKGTPLLTIRSMDIEQGEADLLQNEAQVRADLRRDLIQIDSDIETDKAELVLSKSIYNRMQDLVAEKIASRAGFEVANTQYQKDMIILDTLKRKRDATISLSNERMKILTEPIIQKLNLLGVSDVEIAHVLKTRNIDPIVPVMAPESGLVSERFVNVEELTDSTKPLFTIGDFHEVWIKADVAEKDVAKVQDGQDIELELDSFPGEVFRGTLNYVADSLNSDTRTLPVRAEVPNPGLKLKPKMFARMRIMVGKQFALMVPKNAVQDAGDDKVVFVPLGGGHYEERKVKLGSEMDDWVEVLSGLHPGEKVVTNGSFVLRSESLRESG